MLASTLPLCAVGPATVLSHKCDLLCLLKDDQIMRDNRLPVHCLHLASRRHRTAIPVATRYPPFAYPCLNVPKRVSGTQSARLQGYGCTLFCSHGSGADLLEGANQEGEPQNLSAPGDRFLCDGRLLSVNSPALILSKNSGVFLAKVG